jgi:hypothetical protein
LNAIGAKRNLKGKNVKSRNTTFVAGRACMISAAKQRTLTDTIH